MCKHMKMPMILLTGPEERQKPRRMAIVTHYRLRTHRRELHDSRATIGKTIKYRSHLDLGVDDAKFRSMIDGYVSILTAPRVVAKVAEPSSRNKKKPKKKAEREGPIIPLNETAPTWNEVGAGPSSQKGGSTGPAPVSKGKKKGKTQRFQE